MGIAQLFAVSVSMKMIGLSLAVLVLSSCGYYCVAGIGQCEALFADAKNKGGATTQGGSIDDISLSPAGGPKMLSSETKMIDISGGTKPYKCEMSNIGSGSAAMIGDPTTATRCEFKPSRDVKQTRAILIIKDSKSVEKSIAILID